MNRKHTMISLVLVASLLGVFQARGQTVIRHGGGGEGDVDVLLLTELGAVVGMDEASKNLVVMALLPDADPKAEVKKDDLLMMINGKRVKDMASLRAEYESTAVGADVKVGFRRGDHRFLSSFAKKDPNMQQGTRRMVMIGGPGGEFDDMLPLHEFGVVIGATDGKVVVAMQLPMDDSLLAEHDVIKSINGTAVASLEEFRAVYEPLAIGAAMEVTALRDGEEIHASRTKSEAQGQMRIRRGP